MKMLSRSIFLFVLVFALGSAPVFAGTAQKTDQAKPTPGIELASLVTQVTGIAISPLLGVSSVGAYWYFKANTPKKNPSFHGSQGRRSG